MAIGGTVLARLYVAAPAVRSWREPRRKSRRESRFKSRLEPRLKPRLKSRLKSRLDFWRVCGLNGSVLRQTKALYRERLGVRNGVRNAR